MKTTWEFGPNFELQIWGRSSCRSKLYKKSQMSCFKHVAILGLDIWSLWSNIKTRQANLLTDKIAGSLIWHGWATNMFTYVCLLIVRWNAHPDRFMKQGLRSQNSLFGSYRKAIYLLSRKRWEVCRKTVVQSTGKFAKINSAKAISLSRKQWCRTAGLGDSNTVRSLMSLDDRPERIPPGPRR